MKKALFTLFVCFLVSISSFGQRADGDDIDLKFNTAGDTLIIHILDKQVKDYDLFIYMSTDEVKVNTHTTENPIHVPIAEWRRGIYHIKIDYNFVTQFRNVEIFE
jgi:hypothetical protein